jgi:UPF0755 protein
VISGRTQIAVFLIVGLLLSAYATWRHWIAPPATAGPIIITIAVGATPAEAGVALQNAGVIASARAFVWIVARRGYVIVPGRYHFATPVYPWNAARLLSKGPPPDPHIEVTIPEGKRLPEFAEILERAGVCPAAEFLKAVRDPALVRELLGRDAPDLEGYLFPDTYKFKKGTPAEAIIRRLHARFLERSAGLAAPGLDTHQFVTLASIVEREAAVASERPRIAAVFLNRLKKGMRLEADPTVRFALGKWSNERVLYADLEIESAYNTYRVFGLPPGPISSVGRASLEAVANPMDSDELFFVAETEGRHLFARTYPEHLANIRRVRER